MRLILSFTLLIMPLLVEAVGLGQLRIFSYLNEPLDAEIELIGADGYELDYLVAGLASTQDFKKAALARPYVLTKLRFEVHRTNQNTYVKVYSLENIKQPYIDFLIDLAWPEGRMMKAYTVLLDPPPLNLAHRRPDTDRLSFEVIAEKFAELPDLATERDVPDSNAAAPLDISQKERFSNMVAMEKLFEVKESAKTEIADAVKLEKEVATVADNPEKIQVITPPAATNPEGEEQKIKVEKVPAPAPAPAAPKLDKLQSSLMEKSHMMLITVLLSVAMAAVFVMWYVRKKIIAPQISLASTEDLIALAKTKLESSHATSSAEIAEAEPEVKPGEYTMKLNLAEQYIDIGDFKSSKEIILQVQDHGSDKEKERAQKLLAKINS